MWKERRRREKMHILSYLYRFTFRNESFRLYFVQKVLSLEIKIHVNPQICWNPDQSQILRFLTKGGIFIKGGYFYLEFHWYLKKRWLLVSLLWPRLDPENYCAKRLFPFRELQIEMFVRPSVRSSVTLFSEFHRGLHALWTGSCASVKFSNFVHGSEK